MELELELKTMGARRIRQMAAMDAPAMDVASAESSAAGNDQGSEDNNNDDHHHEEGADSKTTSRDTTNSLRTTIITSNAVVSHPQHHATNIEDENDNDSHSSSSSSAVAHLLHSVARASSFKNQGRQHHNDHSLQKAYKSIRLSSCQAILSSLILYSITAVGISMNTRGLDKKVIAIIVGCSQFLAALMVFIVSAKVPQWIGVYHQGHIRLVKCSSNYSQHFDNIDLDNSDNLRKLKSYVRLGVWFHFSKFYITLMPFYCGVRGGTIPLSIVGGSAIGFILMWSVFGKFFLILFLDFHAWRSM